MFTRSRSLRVHGVFLFLFVLLSGDIELNPGPSAFTLCTLNIRSILHPLHSTALSDLIDTHNPDLFCLTETWIKPTTTAAELLNCTPPHYSLVSTPVTAPTRSLPLVVAQLSLSANLSHNYPLLFQNSHRSSHLLSLQLSHSKLSVINIYRPPSSSTYSKPFSLIFISIILQTLSPLSAFLSLLSSFHLSQHVHFPMHDKDHILDLVITSSDILHRLFLSPIGLQSIRTLSCLHQTVCKPSTTPSSNTSLFPTATLHRHRFFSDRPEILSAHIRSSKKKLDLSCPLASPLYLLSSTNMLLLSTHSPVASLHQTHGFLPPSVHYGPPSAMLKTSGNVLTLLLTGPPSSLSATNTTSSSCLAKKSTSPASYLQPPTTPNILANSQQTPTPQIVLTAAHHFSWHFTC